MWNCITLCCRFFQPCMALAWSLSLSLSLSGQLPRAEVIFSIHVCVLVFMYMCVSLLRGLNLEYWGAEIVSPCNYLLVHTSTFRSNSAPTFRGQGLERGRLPWQPQSELQNASTFCTSPGVGRVTSDESHGTAMAVRYNLHESVEEQSRWWSLSGLCSKPV